MVAPLPSDGTKSFQTRLYTVAIVLLRSAKLFDFLKPT